MLKVQAAKRLATESPIHSTSRIAKPRHFKPRARRGPCSVRGKAQIRSGSCHCTTMDYSERAPSVTFGTSNAPTWSEVNTLADNVEAQNVEPDTSCSYVTSPLGAYRLRTVQRAT